MVQSVIPHVAENQGLCLQQREGTANIANLVVLNQTRPHKIRFTLNTSIEV